MKSFASEVAVRVLPVLTLLACASVAQGSEADPARKIDSAQECESMGGTWGPSKLGKYQACRIKADRPDECWSKGGFTTSDRIDEADDDPELSWVCEAPVSTAQLER